jgi:eukaryotic-like serine/threonine-protein kinase
MVLGGRFAVQRKIGEGTFAEVWLALDAQAADAPVALKIFRPLPEGAGNDAWNPLYREIAAGQRMPAHSNLVRAWALLQVDFFADARTPCLAMDYVPGTNLALWLARQPPPGPETLGARLKVMDGVLRGIAHAHANGVVHQDISFGNVLVQETAELGARLTDFGCAQCRGAADAAAATDDATMLQPINPPPYDLGQPFDDSARRDVYAFATLCYLTLVGRHPLTDDWQAMRAGQWAGPAAPHRNLPRRRLVELGPWLSQVPFAFALSDLLLSCVAAEPDRRPASAGIVWRDWSAIMR